MKIFGTVAIAIALIACIVGLVFAVYSVFTDNVGPIVQDKDPEDVLRNEVHNNCLELIKRYNIYKVENFIEQANDIAKQYNSYILPYTELWKGNLPRDIVIQLPYLQEDKS